MPAVTRKLDQESRSYGASLDNALPGATFLQSMDRGKRTAVSRTVRIALFATAALMFVTGLVFVIRVFAVPPEPVYSGLSLSKWMDGRSAVGLGHGGPKIVHVLNSVGPEALP